MTAILRLQLDDKDPVRVNSAINQLAEFVDRGGGGGGGRTLLTANTTFYVATTGSDANPGTVGSPFLTIQHAYDVIVHTLDTAGFTTTIQCASGAYTSGLAASSSWTGGGLIILDLGGGTISVTSASCISITTTLPAAFTIQNATLTSTVSGRGCIEHSGAGNFNIGVGVIFGSAAYTHIISNGPGSSINILANYVISGSFGAYHYLADGSGANIKGNSKTVTLTGSPAIGVYFVLATRLGLAELYFMTYSGAATGIRYLADTNGVIFTAGGGANYFPGTIAGSTDGFGMYS